MMQLLTERYRDRLAGVLSCYDRIVITGTLPGACYAAGMTSFLNARGIRIFDYPRFAEPLRERIRTRAQEVSVQAGVAIEHLNKAGIRKEDVVAKVLAARGDHPGLVHVISAMEACESYKPWHDKTSGKTYLRPDSGKCLHYYFYFIDEKLGLCYLRVPTWSPFRQDRGQDVRQVRPRAAAGDHHQRGLLLQAPPQGGTSARSSDPRVGAAQEEHLQPHRPA